MCEKGLLDFDRMKDIIKLYDQNKPHNPGESENQTYKVLWQDDAALSKQAQHEIRHFVDCIINDKKPDTDGRTALKSLQVIWRMYEAEKNGTIADLRGLGFDE